MRFSYENIKKSLIRYIAFVLNSTTGTPLYRIGVFLLWKIKQKNGKTY